MNRVVWPYIVESHMTIRPMLGRVIMKGHNGESTVTNSLHGVPCELVSKKGGMP
jgi:hypothetical protein